MDKPILLLDKGTRCTAWNYSGERLVAGLVDGSLAIYDSTDPASSNFTCTSRFKAQNSSILKVVWVPPEYGDAVACISEDGTLSLWEEVMEDTEAPHWKMCKCFDINTSQVLDVQFGDVQTCLKLAVRLCLELITLILKEERCVERRMDVDVGRKEGDHLSAEMFPDTIFLKQILYFYFLHSCID